MYSNSQGTGNPNGAAIGTPEGKHEMAGFLGLIRVSPMPRQW